MVRAEVLDHDSGSTLEDSGAVEETVKTETE